jgi:hypothetical protein
MKYRNYEISLVEVSDKVFKVIITHQHGTYYYDNKFITRKKSLHTLYISNSQILYSELSDICSAINSRIDWAKCDYKNLKKDFKEQKNLEKTLLNPNKLTCLLMTCNTKGKILIALLTYAILLCFIAIIYYIIQ